MRMKRLNESKVPDRIEDLTQEIIDQLASVTGADDVSWSEQ